jgi:hypothetical protein
VPGGYPPPPYDGPPYEQPPYYEPPSFGDPGYEEPYQEPYPEHHQVPYPASPYDGAPLGAGPPPPEWDAPPPERDPPPPRRNAGLYATVAVLVVLAAAGVGYALYLLSGDDEGGSPGAAGTSEPRPAGTAGQSTAPDPSASPRDNIGMNAAMALVDDCLVNDGNAAEPQMRIVPCDAASEAQVFQVLAVFDERVEGEGETANEQAQGICSETEGYTHHYYEVGDTTSFVLCMTEADD